MAKKRPRRSPMLEDTDMPAHFIQPHQMSPLDKLLYEKAEEIRQGLEKWAEEKKVHCPCTKIVFTFTGEDVTFIIDRIEFSKPSG